MGKFFPGEAFLRHKHREGWALQHITLFGFYFFRRCTPEDMVYRMDFQTQKQPEQSPYLQMFQDYGWDYVTDCNSFQIFRKPADRQAPRDDEIFSDDESRLDMMKRMFLRWMLPSCAIFLLLIISPFYHAATEGIADTVDLFLLILLVVFTVLFLCILLYCGWGFYRLRQKYGRK